MPESESDDSESEFDDAQFEMEAKLYERKRLFQHLLWQRNEMERRALLEQYLSWLTPRFLAEQSDYRKGKLLGYILGKHTTVQGRQQLREVMRRLRCFWRQTKGLLCLVLKQDELHEAYVAHQVREVLWTLLQNWQKSMSPARLFQDLTRQLQEDPASPQAESRSRSGSPARNRDRSVIQRAVRVRKLAATARIQGILRGWADRNRCTKTASVGLIQGVIRGRASRNELTSRTAMYVTYELGDVVTEEDFDTAVFVLAVARCARVIDLDSVQACSSKSLWPQPFSSTNTFPQRKSS